MKESEKVGLKFNIQKLRSCHPVSSAAAAAKSLQLCPTLCDPIDGSPPGSLIPGILQARTLEWVAISFSNAGKRKNKVKLLSFIRLLATPWTAAYQAPPSRLQFLSLDLFSLPSLGRRRQWQPTPVLLPGKSHGPRGLVGCSPWGC